MKDNNRATIATLYVPDNLADSTGNGYSPVVARIYEMAIKFI